MKARSLIIGLMLLPTASFAEVIILPAKDLPADIRQDLERLNRDTSPLQTGDATIQSVQPAADPLEPIRRKIAGKLLGTGYDLWLGSHLFKPCVAYKESDVIPINFPQGTVNNDNSYFVRQIEGSKEHFSDRSHSLSGSATYKIFSIGGSTSEYEDEHYKSTSRYIDAYIVSIGHEYTLYDGQPTGDAKTKLADKDPKGFPEMCGQAFVSKVGFGTTLDGEIDFEINVDENSSKNQNSVDLGIKKILSFGADWGKSVKDMTQYSSVSTRIFGGDKIPTPEGFLDAARNFRDSPSAYKSQQEVLIEVTPYSKLSSPEFRNFVNVAAIAEGVVQKYSWDRVQVYQQLSNLHNASDPTLAKYFKLPADISKIIASHETYLNKLGELYQKCQPAVTSNQLDQCKKFASQLPPMPLMASIELVNQK